MCLVNTRSATHKWSSSVFLFLRRPWFLCESRVLKIANRNQSVGGVAKHCDTFNYEWSVVVRPSVWVASEAFNYKWSVVVRPYSTFDEHGRCDHIFTAISNTCTRHNYISASYANRNGQCTCKTKKWRGLV